MSVSTSTFDHMGTAAKTSASGVNLTLTKCPGDRANGPGAWPDRKCPVDDPHRSADGARLIRAPKRDRNRLNASRSARQGYRNSAPSAGVPALSTGVGSNAIRSEAVDG
jgi:hypothetical protein